MRIYRSLGMIVATLALAIAPAGAQVRTVDPNSAIDADLAPRPSTSPAPTSRAPDPVQDMPVDPGPVSAPASASASASDPVPAAGDLPSQTTAAASADTYKRDDVLAAAEGVFGKGAQGLAEMVEKLLREQGEPNAYIAGREVSGAFIVGVRYGSGVMTHRIEGERKVYWTGPSLGFDIGGDAAKVFVLAYNLHDSQEIYKRFPAAEGRLYLIGGFAATYLRRGDTVLIPIHLGVGWRAGVNVGYMNFTEKSKIVPF